MTDTTNAPTRQTRRERADDSRRIQGDIGGRARAIKRAAPPVRGGDCSFSPLEAAHSRPQNPTNAPLLRREAERLRRRGRTVAQIADALRLTLPSARRLLAEDMALPCAGCPMTGLCRTNRLACDAAAEWSTVGRYDPDALRRPRAATFDAITAARTAT